MKLRPYSSTVLALGGAILMALGLYFVFLRPPLLPEDLRYMGTSLSQLQATLPGLLTWLHRVFWVLGGYMFAAGLLTVYAALTVFRSRAKGAAVVVAVAGLASIGWMAAVNFIIGSDFKWLLLAFAILWAIALGLYRIETVPSQ
jgi:hypothetical protein